MWESWEKRKERSRRRQKREEAYTWADILFDIVLWVPEVLALPFRLLYYFGRLIFKIFGYILEAI
ncbi:hypothetical protein SAMN04490247_0801 [Salimicrobium halophilum]|uniref:Uncharacterized protein n=1 Tax=Salimicrobium halophilum TaxID=86666 RepID=A0A1G8R3M0_9BACI|nr:hypothetical protein SAMN04490247_0801 [Salimicrobium halophilum]